MTKDCYKLLKKVKMRILFVCKHNRFRSKVAEAIFNSLSKNKEDKAISRGVKNGRQEYVAENTIEVMKGKGYLIEDIKSKLLGDKDIEWADKIVIVADNVSSETFPREKTEIWKVEDCSEFNKPKIKERAGLIEENVKELLQKISN